MWCPLLFSLIEDRGDRGLVVRMLLRHVLDRRTKIFPPPSKSFPTFSLSPPNFLYPLVLSVAKAGIHIYIYIPYAPYSWPS
jgi:hypothetical protein